MTECVGLLKKVVWATVTKCLLSKGGVFTYQQITEMGHVGYRNEMCGCYRKRLFGLKKRNAGFVCHGNEISGLQKRDVCETCIFSSMKMGYFYGVFPNREDNDFLRNLAYNESECDIVKIYTVWCHYYL